MNNKKFEPGDEIEVVEGFLDGYKGVVLTAKDRCLVQVDLHTFPTTPEYANEKGECCRVESFESKELKLVSFYSISNIAMKVLLMSSIK